jgi:hypothetical protein
VVVLADRFENALAAALDDGQCHVGLLDDVRRKPLPPGQALQLWCGLGVAQIGQRPNDKRYAVPVAAA